MVCNVDLDVVSTTLTPRLYASKRRSQNLVREQRRLQFAFWWPGEFLRYQEGCKGRCSGVGSGLRIAGETDEIDYVVSVSGFHLAREMLSETQAPQVKRRSY